MSLSTARGGDSLLQMSSSLSSGSGDPGRLLRNMEGTDFDEMSALTMQSLQKVHVIDWVALLNENEGVAEEKVSSKERLRIERAARETKALAEALGKKEEDILKEEEEEEGGNRKTKSYADIKTDRARASDDLEFRQAKIVKELKKQRLDYMPSNPDFFMPTESVIICTSIISVHSDILPQEQEMANKWLGIWNDGSRQFQRLMTKGTHMSA
jgi:hypothetical protein